MSLGSSTSDSAPVRAPAESYRRLFARFLRFGLNAWGGPVAQIDMIRHELVTEERWVTPDYFRKLLAVYQALPGPEAHELCVHFGMLARGRWGGVLAGLGFMLPGFVLIFALSWFYLRAGVATGWLHAAFLGMQPAVVALIIRATHRIGQHCLINPLLWTIAALAAFAEALGLSFWLSLPLGALAAIVGVRTRWATFVTAALGAGLIGFYFVHNGLPSFGPERPRASLTVAVDPPNSRATTTPSLFGSGLRAGLLTFGGAYTAIPFLEEDAVMKGRWMTQSDFLHGVALAGVLPAPLIIFSTFVGYAGGGPWGAIAMTLGVFLPAFAFPLLLHRRLERVIENPLLRHALEGVTASVVGIIAVTALRLGLHAINDLSSALIAAGALLVVSLWKARIAVPVVMLSAGICGALLH